MKTSNCVINTSVFHAAVMACALLSSSLFPSEPALAQGCPTPSFGPPRWFGAGVGPVSVAVGDFNGDGKLDLAVANGSGTVSVLLGNGDGTFRAAVNYRVGLYPWSVAVGDFNGDGKLDLAVDNLGDESANPGFVSVLMGNGDGTFQAAANYDTGMTSYSVAVGDFNKDGKLDLVVASRGSLANLFSDGNVWVLLGNGDGTFQPAVAYGPEVNARFVAVGDFNGDGNPDLAVAATGMGGAGAGISVLLGNGDGTFQSAVGYDSGEYDTVVVVGDFNGDGKLDLAVANGSGTVRVLLGNGDGTFQTAASYAVGLVPLSMAVGDFNGDGQLDLVVANAAVGDSPSGTLSVLLGNGDGTFQTAITYGAGTNADPWCAAVGDFNGDGKPDLAVANNASANVAVLLNTCVSPGPSLAVSFSNATLTVSWPFPSTGFVLESTPSLSPPNWQPDVEAPLTNNSQLVVTVQIDQHQRYFRLHKP
jgi:hypothetical protein